MRPGWHMRVLKRSTPAVEQASAVEQAPATATGWLSTVARCRYLSYRT